MTAGHGRPGRQPKKKAASLFHGLTASNKPAHDHCYENVTLVPILCLGLELTL